MAVGSRASSNSGSTWRAVFGSPRPSNRIAASRSSTGPSAPASLRRLAQQFLRQIGSESRATSDLNEPPLRVWPRPSASNSAHQPARNPLPQHCSRSRKALRVVWLPPAPDQKRQLVDPDLRRAARNEAVSLCEGIEERKRASRRIELSTAVRVHWLAASFLAIDASAVHHARVVLDLAERKAS